MGEPVTKLDLSKTAPEKRPIAQLFLHAHEENAFDTPIMFKNYGYGIPDPLNPNKDKVIATDTDWTWVAGDKIAKTASGAVFGLYRKGKLIDQNDLLYERIENISPETPWHEFAYTTFKQFILTGGAFHYKVLNALMQPLWMYNMFKEYGEIRIEKDVFGRIVKYIRMSPEGMKEYAPETMSYFRYFNIASSTYGRGPGTAMPHMVALDTQIKKFTSSAMSKGISKAGWLTQDVNKDSMSDPKYNRLKAELNEDWTGDEVKGIGILEPGMQFIEAQNSLRDFQNAELFAIIRDQVAQTHGIPKSVMGISEATNRADAEAGIYVYMKYCIEPYLKWFESYFTRQFVKLIDPTVTFKYDNCVPRDREIDMKLAVMSVDGGIVTRNEARKEFDHDPVTSGDSILVSRNLAKLEDVVNGKATPSPVVNVGK